MNTKQKLEKYQENSRKAQRAYRKRKVEAGLTRATAWVRKGEEQVVVLPSAVAERLNDLRKRYPDEFAQEIWDMPNSLHYRLESRKRASSQNSPRSAL